MSQLIIYCPHIPRYPRCKIVTGFLPDLAWLIVPVLVGNTIFMLRFGGFSAEAYIQGIVVAVGAGVTTALWTLERSKTLVIKATMTAGVV